MQPEELETLLTDIVHLETQLHDDGIDLTAARIHAWTGPGRIDFGGSELEPATHEPIDTSKRDPDDEYGWWRLDPGTYLVEYNEFLESDGEERLILQPRDELLAQGVVHPTIVVSSGIPKMPLTVGDAGARIKENARVSTLLPA